MTLCVPQEAPEGLTVTGSWEDGQIIIVTPPTVESVLPYFSIAPMPEPITAAVEAPAVPESAVASTAGIKVEIPVPTVLSRVVSESVSTPAPVTPPIMHEAESTITTEKEVKTAPSDAPAEAIKSNILLSSLKNTATPATSSKTKMSMKPKSKK